MEPLEGTCLIARSARLVELTGTRSELPLVAPVAPLPSEPPGRGLGDHWVSGRTQNAITA